MEYVERETTRVQLHSKKQERCSGSPIFDRNGSTHYGVVFWVGTLIPRLCFAYRGLCTVNSYGVFLVFPLYFLSEFGRCFSGNFFEYAVER